MKLKVLRTLKSRNVALPLRSSTLCHELPRKSRKHSGNLLALPSLTPLVLVTLCAQPGKTGRRYPGPWP